MSVVETPKQNNVYGLDSRGYYCTLKFMEYKRPKPFDTTKENVVFTAVMPLPNELRDNTSAEFTSPTALNAIGDLVNEAGWKETALASGLRNSDAIMNKVRKGVQKGLSAATGGVLDGGALDAIDTKAIATVLQQHIGTAPNPNQTVSFEGPSLRRHDFSWTLQPNNEKESKAIHKLIKKFKSLTLPSTATASGAALLKFPHMCIINFYPWDNNPSAENIYGWSENSIIKIKKCFVTGVNVNYSPAGVPGFFEGTHNPFAVSIAMSMVELEYMLAEDFDASVKGSESVKGILEPLKAFAERVGDGTDKLPEHMAATL